LARRVGLASLLAKDIEQSLEETVIADDTVNPLFFSFCDDRALASLPAAEESSSVEETVIGDEAVPLLLINSGAWTS